MTKRIGPAGGFPPGGPPSPVDRSKLNASIGVEKGRVVLRLEASVTRLSMSPEQALAVSDSLRKHALAALAKRAH